MSEKISDFSLIFDIDKEYIPYLYMAINAIKDKGFDIEKFYVDFYSKHLDNQECYEVLFSDRKITVDNWMYGYGVSINVLIDIKNKKILNIYHGR